MTENKASGIYLAYTVGVTVLGTYLYSGEEDGVLVSFLGSQLLLFIYVFFCMLTNYSLKIKKRFKLSPPKRFETKKNPIYKVKAFSICFKITRYDLEWYQLEDYFWTVPFIFLFLKYGYVHKGSYEFTASLKGDEDLASLWAQEKLKEKKADELLIKKWNREKDLNREFEENYE